MSPNTEFEIVNDDSDSEYSEELKLQIPCDNDNSHFAVLYCQKCEVDLCSVCCENIHCWPAVAKHEIVRLTEKPEAQNRINCYLHPQKAAEIVCKDPSCEGINKPICIVCQQYGTHKNHTCEILETEYNKLQKTISSCLEAIDIKTKAFDKNMEKYQRCIGSYSATDDDFPKSEREKIDKFYSDARTLALKTFDDFMNNRIEDLTLLQKQYENDKTNLENVKTLLQSFEGMSMKDMIEIGEDVRTLAKQAAKNIDDTKDIIPFRCYSMTYPNLESSNIKIEADQSVISKLPNQGQTLAVYFIDPDSDAKVCNNIYRTHGGLDAYLRSSGKNVRCAQKFEMKNDKLVITKTLEFDEGRSLLYMDEKPNVERVDLSQHKYISLIHCNIIDRKKRGEFYSLLAEQMENKWFSRIVVMVDYHIWEDQMEFVDKITEIAGTDERVEVWGNGEEEKIDILFKN